MTTTSSYINRIHESSELLAWNAGIEINTSKIDEFLEKEIFSDLVRYAKLANSFKFAFPLNFENDVEELTLIGLIALLNFGGEYDPVLYEQI